MTETKPLPMDPAASDTASGPDKVDNHDGEQLAGGTDVPFDPTHPQYQKTKRFQPDKEKTWKFPKEKDGWVEAHKMLKGEVTMIQDCLQAIQDRDEGVLKHAWQVEALRKVLQAHHINMHTHHTNEDAVLEPALNKRFHYPQDHAEDHAALVQKMDEIQTAVRALHVGDAVAKLQAMLDEYRRILEPHMQHEEDFALPLMRAYFTPPQFKRVMAKTFITAPTVDKGGFVYFMGEERFRNEFMKQEQIPPFVWHVVFKKCLAWYQTNVVVYADALQKGVETTPPPPKRPWLCGGSTSEQS